MLVDVTKSVASAKILEEIEISRAIFEVYEGGVVRRRRPIETFTEHIVSKLTVHTPRTTFYCECDCLPNSMSIFT